MLKNIIRKVLNIKDEIPDYPNGNEENKDMGVTVLPCKIRIPVSSAIFTIPFEKIEYLQREKIYSPGIVMARGRFQGKTVGCKIFNVTFVDDNDALFRELYQAFQICQKIHHPNLSEFRGIYHDYPRFGIVHSYSQRNLKQLIERKKDGNLKINFVKKVQLLLEISRAMESLHELDIFHRFLCCENVMFSEQNKAFVTGFFCSRFEDKQNKERRTKRYGAYYQAPEHTLDNQETMKSDVFSFAIVMFEVLVEKMNPFSEFGDIANRIANDPTLRPNVPGDFKVNQKNVWWIDLMKRCWEFFPHRRPHFIDIAETIDKNLKILQEVS